MTRVHGLEHVERLAAANLADDDPIGAHPERVADQVANRHFSFALDVRGPCLERDDVRLDQKQLGRVLDGDQPLVIRDGRRQDAEHRRLSRPRAAGHDDVGSASNATREEPEHPRSHASSGHQVIGRDRYR
jgi:hypothetical protein